MTDEAATTAAPGQTQSLLRGLRMLRMLVESDQPLSATELARRCGLHQSSASRILATLAEEGYVRKDSYRSFVPDYGILAMALSASPHFPIMDKPAAAMREAAERVPGLTVSLCLLWRGEMIYFLRTTAERRAVLFEATGFPLHLSSPALRFVADLPDDEAMALLSGSRHRFGWQSGLPGAPADERATIEWARQHIDHDCLIVDFAEPDHISAAVTVRSPDPHPVALALSGPADIAGPDKLRLLLHEFRRDVETALFAAD